MANNLNDFLKTLGIASPQYENSPMDDLATDDAPIFKVPVEEDEPALEESDMAPGKPGPLASKADIATMAQYPRSPAEERIAGEIKASDEAQPSLDLLPEQEIASPQTQAPAQMSRYKDLLEKYNNQNRNLALLQGANQIAKGLAAGAGGKIDDGSEAVKMLQGMNQDPLKQIQSEDAASMADANSDISKFYRQQAYAGLKKLYPDRNYEGRLDQMSASQLAKLPGMTNLFKTQNPASPWIATDRVDESGNPIRFNRQTGEYSRADGSPIQPGTATFRDIMRKDELTGNYALGNAQGMKVLPTRYGNATIQPQASQAEGQKPKEYSYAELKNVSPKEVREFDDVKQKMIADMKDSRDVASATTNLAHKLTPGANGEIDSGLLGGIQTQAAKMAGQKGVLTDQDLVKFAGAGGVQAKLNRIIDGSIFGEMTDEDIKFFNRFAELMNQSLEEDIRNRAQIFVGQGQQLLERVAPGITENNVSKLLGVDKVAPAVQNNSKITSNSKPGEVKRKTADGKIAIFDEKTKKFLRYEE